MKQHSPRFLALVAAVKLRIKELDSHALKEKMISNERFHLVDIREDHEWVTGHIKKAIHLSKGIIERDIEKTIPDIHAPIVVYCSGGFRGVHKKVVILRIVAAYCLHSPMNRLIT